MIERLGHRKLNELTVIFLMLLIDVFYETQTVTLMSKANLTITLVLPPMLGES